MNFPFLCDEKHFWQCNETECDNLGDPYVWYEPLSNGIEHCLYDPTGFSGFYDEEVHIISEQFRTANTIDSFGIMGFSIVFIVLFIFLFRAMLKPFYGKIV